MTDREQYTPGPASGAQVQKRTERSGRSFSSASCATRRKKSGRRSPTRRICASGRPLTDGNLATVGTVKLTWVGAPTPHAETKVTRADAPKRARVRRYPLGTRSLDGGTRLTLWHNIDRRFISWGAAGWHICFRCSGSPSQRNSHRPHRRRRRHEVRRLAAPERGVRQAIRSRDPQAVPEPNSKLMNRG